MTFPTEIFSAMEQSIIDELTELLEGGYFDADAENCSIGFLKLLFSNEFSIIRHF